MKYNRITLRVFFHNVDHQNACDIRVAPIDLKFKYSEKATKFCKIFPLLMTTLHRVKSKVEIPQNFVAFSEYMNFHVDKSKVEILQNFVAFPEYMNFK